MNTIKIEKIVDALLFKGVLTFETSEKALEALKKHFPESGDVCLDFGGVTKSDSSALALLTELLRRANATSVNLKIRNMPRKLMDLARVSGLDSILPIQE